jgi:hypothetical protein
MPDVPKPDLDKILRTHRSLRSYKEIHQNEWIHRVIIGVLAITGFVGTVTVRWLGTLLYIAVIYFIVAVWQGWITLWVRRPSGQDEEGEGQDTGQGKGAPPT